MPTIYCTASTVTNLIFSIAALTIELSMYGILSSDVWIEYELKCVANVYEQEDS